MNIPKWCFTFGFALAAWLTAASAQAQFQYTQPQTNPFGSQTVSPFLNLGRGGSVANNYFNLVRPQFQTQNSLLSMQRRQNYFDTQQQQELQRSSSQPGAYSTTGHRSYFMSYSHFYPQMRAFVGPFGGQR